MTVINPFDFFIETVGRAISLHVRAVAGARAAPLSGNRAGRPAADGVPGGDRPPRQKTVDFLVALNSSCSKKSRYLIRMEPGVQTCEETLTWAAARAAIRPGCWCRCCGIWAWPRGLSRAISIQLVPRRQAARRPGRRRRRFHRPARLDRGLYSRRGLGRARSDLRLVGRRRAHAAGLLADPSLAPRRSPAASIRARPSSRSTMSIARIHEDPRVTKPYTEEQWARSRHLGTKSTRGWRPATCV